MIQRINPRWKFDELVSLEEERQPYAEHITEQGAHHADDRALKHEDPADHPLGRAHGHQDGDVVRFFHDQHDQRGDDGEGADEDDHRQQDEHADFFKLQRSEEIGVHVHPCPDGSQRAELLLEGGGHGIGLVYVLDGDLDAGNLIGRQAQQIARSRKGDEPERRIVFEHAGLENARNLVGTDAGLETGGGLLSGRRKEVDAAAHDQAEALCQFLADEHAGRRALHGSVQVRDAAAAQVVQHGQDVRRGLGVDTPQDDAFDASRGGQHAFRVEEGGGADDAGSGVDAPEHSRHAGEFGGFAAAHFFEVRIRRRRGERRQRTGNDDVRVRAEDFIPDVRREPVVDAENHDQRGDAYSHAKHGHG